MSALTFDGLSLAVGLGFAATLGLLLAGVRAGIRMLNLNQARRAMVARVLPVIELMVMLLYAAAAIPAVFGDGPLAAVTGGGVLVVAVFASWAPLRDLVSGVFIKASGSIKVGDTLEVGATRGRVKKIGFRVVHLETAHGDEAWVPFSHLARETVVRTPAAAGSYTHRFLLPAPADEKVGDAKHLIREISLLSHWSQVARDPEVQLAAAPEGQSGPEGQAAVLKVLVFPIDPGRGPDIEASVRRALQRARMLPEDGADHRNQA